nr:hypothetical protein [Tanacetum cinerariifolium]
MKTKRKLVPMSIVVSDCVCSGQGNVVALNVYDNVCGVGPSVYPKRQCVRQSNSVPCHDKGLQVGLSVSSKTQCVRQSNSAPYHDQGLQVSGVPGVGSSVSLKTRYVCQSNSVPCRDQGLQPSRVPPAFLFVIGYMFVSLGSLEDIPRSNTTKITYLYTKEYNIQEKIKNQA